MPRLSHLDLSDNRLRKFPWRSLHNVPNITYLILDNNEISEVDDYVDFPQSLRWLYLRSNRITTIPETFLNGLKPPKLSLFLRITQNPFLCDCEIQWIARLRRCVWEYREEGCVDARSHEVRTCMLANCNFHSNGALVIVDRIDPTTLFVNKLSPDELLKCDSPPEMKGVITAFLCTILAIMAIAFIGRRVKPFVCSAYQRRRGSSGVPLQEGGPTSLNSRRCDETTYNDYIDMVVSPLAKLRSDEDVPPPLPPRNESLVPLRY
ncbi:SLIT3 [Branchiostoma lanceolatum]|uniref:SLIT3 protein n=1 Tax=Branchiostoma lanceolatum TaxID=7740 RepID=A0A8J9ZFG8_BRALA|nr:SLIT3 [Branchiostoma lanceolatum]